MAGSGGEQDPASEEVAIADRATRMLTDVSRYVLVGVVRGLLGIAALQTIRR